MAEKIRFIVGVGDLLGCGYYRCALPYKALSELGFDVYLTNKLDMELGPNDVLVLQRQHSDGILKITEDFKAKGGKVIFELDDYFHDLPAHNPARASYPKGGPQIRNLERFMALSDLMTVSTPALSDNYSKFANNIHICYNVLDDKVFDNPLLSANLRAEDGTFRLGWAGSATHADDFITIVKPVAEILREFKNVTLVFVGMDYRKMFPFDVQSRMEYAGHTFPVEANGKPMFYSPEGNSVQKYYELLKVANFDAAIAPIAPISFNRAKSYVKLLEYGLCKIPFVATRYGPYSQYVGASSWHNRHTQSGLLSETNSDWKRNIKELITNPSLRTTLAENNHKLVQDKHTIKTGVQQWVDALSSIGIHPDGEPGEYVEKIVKG